MWQPTLVIAWQAKAGLTPEFLRDLQELRRVVEPAAVRLAAERATPADIEGVSAAYEGMKRAIEEGGDYVSHDMHFHTGMLVASHNRMIVQMSKALGALLRTSFEISTTRKDAPRAALPLHKAVLDAVVAKNPDKAEKAIRVLIEGARQDMEHVLTTRRKLPSLSGPAKPIKAP
ncbi:MAG: FadR family transcriptional regulator [Betaproteobacteria bacterium]|nr:FadR family transcriptional regulator [Betaproteobacteria bacterium]